MTRAAKRAALCLGLVEQTLLLIWRHLHCWTEPATPGAVHTPVRAPSGLVHVAPVVSNDTLAKLRTAAKRPLQLAGGRTAAALVHTLRALKESPAANGRHDARTALQTFALVNALNRKISGALVAAHTEM